MPINRAGGISLAATAILSRITMAHRERYWIAAGVLCVLAVWCWSYRNGVDSYIRIHDGLDSNVSILGVLGPGEYFFASGETPFEPMANVPRASLAGATELSTWSYRWLPTLSAYAFNELWLRLAAFISMVLLLRDHIFPPTGRRRAVEYLTTYGSAFCFALMPVWPMSSLGIFGQPMVLWALLNLRPGYLATKYQGEDAAKRRRLITIISIAVMVIYGMFSSLVLVGAFVIFAAYTITFLLGLRDRCIPWMMLAACLVLTIGAAAGSYQLFVQRFSKSDFVSMRTAYTGKDLPKITLNSKHGYTRDLAWWEVERSFEFGNNAHAPSKHSPYGFLAIALAAGCGCLLLYRWELVALMRQTDLFSGTGWIHEPLESRTPYRSQFDQLLLITLLVLLAWAFSWWQGAYRLPIIGELVRATGIGLMAEINLARFQWLAPTLWTLIFVICLRVSIRIAPQVAILVVLLIGGQAAFLYYEGEHVQEARGNNLTWREFYSEALFDEIRNETGEPSNSNRVVSVGMHPAISLANGFYTADGYSTNYALEYKQQFRKIIADELAKDRELQEHFDYWGGNFYIFSAELGRNYFYTKSHSKRRIEQLDINIEPLRELGVKHIISAVEIGNAQELGLEFAGQYSQPDLPWELTLYRLGGKQ